MSVPTLAFQTNRKCDKEMLLATFDKNRWMLVTLEDKLGKCCLVNEFEKLIKLGSGTYGVVYKAKDTKSGEIVAMKKLKIKKYNEGLPRSFYREIGILQKLKHENIVNLKDVVVGKILESIFLVMEYCEQDLSTVLDQPEFDLNESQVKCIMKQLFTGLTYLHRNYVVHRDLKLSNLLLTKKGCLKIADFGLARRYGYPAEPMTPGVVTLWYRAFELLMAAETHTSAVDMWAAGCIFAELLLKKPFLPGVSELGQIKLIIDLLGTPNDQVWPEYSSLPLTQEFTFKVQPLNNMKKRFPNLAQPGIDLLNVLFRYDPKHRIKAEDALQSYYLALQRPFPCKADELASALNSQAEIPEEKKPNEEINWQFHYSAAWLARCRP